MRIALVNGIATHGKGNIDELIEPLRDLGHDVVDVDLPKRHFISAWWGHKADSDAIWRQAVACDAVIAHSFGGPRAWEADRRCNFQKLIFIAPAMDQHTALSNRKREKQVYCLHSEADLPVRIGSWLPWHPFGRAGVNGFSDPVAMNFEFGCGHSGYFKMPLLSDTVRLIHRCLND